jgi:hypothetical protein
LPHGATPDYRASRARASVLHANPHRLLYGTPLVINDMAIEEIVPIKERVKFAFQIEASNVFNHPALNVGTTNGTLSIDSPSFGQTTSPLAGGPSLQIPARVDW